MLLIPINPEAVRELRAELGLTQVQLAEAADIAEYTVILMEGGKRKLGFQEHIAQKVARALDTSVNRIAAGPPVRLTRPDLRKS